MTTLGAALAQATRHIGAREARWLVEHVTGLDRAGQIAHADEPLEASDVQRLRTLAARVSGGEPLHRILGEREFHGLALALGPDTLEPRDDTEALVELALEWARERGPCDVRIADLGTGTGAVGLALLSEWTQAHATLTDISEGALAVARANAERHDLAERTTFSHGEWCEPLEGAFDLVVSNPPYIATDVIGTLDRSVREHDPHCALDGGTDGLDAYRTILVEAPAVLTPDGALMLEIGFDQCETVPHLAAEAGWRMIASRNDSGGIMRAIHLERGPNDL